MYDDLNGIFYSQTRFCFDDLEQFVQFAGGLRLPQRQAVKDVSVMRSSYPSDYYSDDQQHREAVLCKRLFVDGLLLSFTDLQYLEIDASYLQHKSHENYIHSHVWRGTGLTARSLPRLRRVVCERVCYPSAERELYIAHTSSLSDCSHVAFVGGEAIRAVQVLIEEWQASGRWRKGFDEDVFDIPKRYCKGCERVCIWGLPRKTAERGRMAREERAMRSLKGMQQPCKISDMRIAWLGVGEGRRYEDQKSEEDTRGDFSQRIEKTRKARLRQTNGAEKYVVKVIAVREAVKRDAKEKKQ